MGYVVEERRSVGKWFLPEEESPAQLRRYGAVRNS
jgi:hypothetical protein